MSDRIPKERLYEIGNRVEPSHAQELYFAVKAERRALEEVLKLLTYEYKGRRHVAMHGDTDVTEQIYTILQKEN